MQVKLMLSSHTKIRINTIHSSLKTKLDPYLPRKNRRAHKHPRKSRHANNTSHKNHTNDLPAFLTRPDSQ
ncbi:MAG: hypothetical protein BYD32DRAFT_64663 [Podila humilis]|nr:MAG: hypothetical protein BYD32DRAFT_64663 [Podila humilis]